MAALVLQHRRPNPIAAARWGHGLATGLAQGNPTPMRGGRGGRGEQAQEAPLVPPLVGRSGLKVSLSQLFLARAAPAPTARRPFRPSLPARGTPCSSTSHRTRVCDKIPAPASLPFRFSSAQPPPPNAARHRLRRPARPPARPGQESQADPRTHSWRPRPWRRGRPRSLRLGPAGLLRRRRLLFRSRAGLARPGDPHAWPERFSPMADRAAGCERGRHAQGMGEKEGVRRGSASSFFSSGRGGPSRARSTPTPRRPPAPEPSRPPAAHTRCTLSFFS